ncbi:MAG TPA: type II secretion system protein GspJ [Bacillota bacterium]
MENRVKRSLKELLGNAEAGVTLLEMIAALSLTAFLLGILSQLLYSGARLWEHQSRSYQWQHQLRLVYQTLYHDFSNAVCGVYLPENAIKGDDLKVQLWGETPSGLYRITYQYDSATGTVTRTVGRWGEEAEAVPLFKGIKSWKLEYFEATWKSWVAEWDPEQKDELPSLIRVTLATKAGRLGTLTFPVKVWYQRDEL